MRLHPSKLLARRSIVGFVAFALLLAFVGSLLAPGVALAASFTVNTTADTVDATPGNGVCADAGGQCSLRAAIMEANALAGADTITLPAGTYTLTRSGVDNNAVNGDLDVTGPLTINGFSQGTTFIQAGASGPSAIDRVFSFNPLGSLAGFAVSLNNLTVQNGKNPNAFSTFESDGGCLDFDGGTNGAGSLTLNSVTVSNCETTDGDAGGVALFLSNGGTISITGSTIQNNIASRNTPNSGSGGGMSVFCVNNGASATVTINTSAIQGNATRSVGGTNNGQGGGMFVFGACAGTPTFNYQLHGVTISGNSAGNDGGGIYSTAPLTIDTGSVISNNSSGRFGGGIRLSHTGLTSTITKATLTGNTAAAGGAGGAIRLDNGTLNLSYSRIASNTSPAGTGDGLSVNGGTANAANNWWGCSTGPSAAPCDIAKLDGGGSLTSSPYLRLNLSASPTTLVTNQTSSLTANFNLNSAATDVSANIDVLKGLPITWPAVGGSISGASATISNGGTAAATYTATAAAAGNQVAAVVDNDSTTAPGTNIVQFTVNKAATTTTITSDPTDPSVTGQAVPVSFSVVGASGNSPTAPTGNVTVSDGTSSCTGTVASGFCTITLATAGSKTLTATYAGDSNFTTSTSAGEPHIVNKADTTTTITSDTPDPSVVGQPVTVNYTVTTNAPGSGTPTGNVTVSDGAASCTGTVAAGSCVLTFTSVGAKTVTATYAGDANYNGSTSATATHQVNQASTTTTITSDVPDPSIVGQAVTVQFAVAAVAPGAGTPTGNVTVSDGTISCTTTVAAGQCSLTFPSKGARTLTATYAGDSNFLGSTSTSAPHQVDGIPTTTTITADLPDPSVVGETVTISYSVTPTVGGPPSGTVTVSDGTLSCSGTVAAGACSITFTSPGAKILAATYAGDSAFAGSTSATAGHQVNQASTTVVITANTPNPSIVNQAVTVSYSVTPVAPGAGTPSGNVTVSDGTISCTGTVAAGQCSLTFPSKGARTLTATYVGDSNFLGSTSAGVPHQVDGIPTTTTISADAPDPSVVGQPVTISYSVAPTAGGGTPTGNVTVSDGTLSCSGTVAAGACSITFTSAGAKTLTATYAGDSTFATSISATAAHQVDQASTTVAITADTPDPSLVNQAVTVSYSVTPVAPGAGTPTGNVTVSDGTTSCTATVAAGQCSLTFPSSGARTLTATYAGDSDFVGSTSAGVPHQVDGIPTTTTITADTPDPSVVGETVTITYSVAPTAGGGTPTGTVTVSDGTLSCTDTVAAGACTITFTSAGAKSLTATYSGDSTFATSTSATASHQVNKPNTTVVITANTPNPSLVNQAVTVSYSVTPVAPGAGTPTGNVTVSDGTTSCTATVAAGQCSLTFPSSGARTLTATYAGDSNFTGSTSAGVAHQVDGIPTTTTITADAPDPSVVGQTVTINYSVAPTAGGGTPTGNVTVSDGTNSCTGSVAAGACTITFSSPGSATLTATYAGDSAFAGSTSATAAHQIDQASTTTTITADTPDPSVVGETVTINYSVSAAAPGAGTPTGNVTVSDGTDSCTGTVAAGSCTISFSSAGAKSLTATYAGDSNFTGSTSASAAHTVNKADTTTAITADTPDPSLVGQTVTVTYSVTVNAPGAGTPTGNVTVSDGTVSCTGTVATGSCTLTFGSTGVKSLTATYAGDSDFNGSGSASAAHTVTAPDLTITKSHSGNFSQTQTGATYSITVSNSGDGPTSSMVTVTDTLPSGLTATAMGGTGWSCTLATLVCTRSDALANGSSYPPITLTVDVAANAPASVTNSATVAVVGEVVTNNNTANDPTTITQLPDLTVTKTNNLGGSAIMGQSWTWTITVTNGGSADASFASGQTVLRDSLPNSASISYGSPTNDVGLDCIIDGNKDLTCTTAPTLIMTSGSSLHVQVSAVASAPGSYANPRSGGSCVADPNNVVTEIDKNNNSCSDSVSVNSASTTTTITSHQPNPSVVGQAVTVQYSVSVNAPGTGTPTGNVTVSDGTDSCTATVGAGQCTITFTTVGSKTLVATYAGDSNVAGSASAGTAHTVDKAATTTTISADTPDPSSVGQQVTVSFGVAVQAPGAGTPTGNVTVSDGTDSCTATVAAGQCAISFTTAGSKTLVATYAGDSNFSGSASAGEPHTVKAVGVSVTPTSVSVAEGGATASYQVVLTSQPTADVTISISTDGQTTVNPTSLTFTSANWNVAQSVTVTAVDDTIVEGPHSSTISHKATSGDTNYSGISIAQVTAAITDNDSVSTYTVYLPVVKRDVATPLPDLVVDKIIVTGTTIQVVVLNQGNGPVTSAFWVDLYVNPSSAPTAVNQIWQNLAKQGATWGVNSGALPLAPGGRLTLTLGDSFYRGDLSNLSGTLAAGTPIYVQVDSANTLTTYGGVLESHEQNGGAYNNISSTTVPAGGVKLATTSAAGTGSDGGLPVRPAR